MTEKNILLEHLEQLKRTLDEYFDIFIKTYPGIDTTNEKQNEFGSPKLCELSIKAQAFLVSFGEQAIKRFNYIGFDILFPFDNPVDQYNWRAFVQKNNISHTIFSTIAIRIDSEIERLKNLILIDSFSTYDCMDENHFLVSKERYNEYFSIRKENSGDLQLKQDEGLSNVTVENVNINFSSEKNAINSLHKAELRTSIWSNLVNIIAKII